MADNVTEVEIGVMYVAGCWTKETCVVGNRKVSEKTKY